jgi:putative transposase
MCYNRPIRGYVMARKRHSEEQIIGALKRVDMGQSMTDVCREIGVSQTTFYKWREKFGGMEVSDARRLRQLEDENKKLKHIVADLTLDIRVLKDVLEKKV